MSTVTDNRIYVTHEVAAEILEVEIVDIRATIKSGQLDSRKTDTGDKVLRIQIQILSEGRIDLKT